MQSVDNREVKRSSRRTKKVKNLEEEVELIFSQDENIAELNVNENKAERLGKTPSRRDRFKDITSPKTSQFVPDEMLQTPRRSCRKSFKPSQDYEDIVNKSLRSCNRSTKKALLVTEEEEVGEDEENENENAAPRWTPAKVGRTSQKRGRKSRRNTKGKKKQDSEAATQKNKERTTRSSPQVQKIDQLDEDLGKEKQIKNIVQNEISDELRAPEVQLKLDSKIKYNEVDDKIENHLQFTKEKNEDDNSQKLHNENEVLALNESIHRIEEYAEDCEEFVGKAEKEDICIVYENNIGNNDTKVECEDHNIQNSCSEIKKYKKELDDSFGSYLKSNAINMLDLGLNPLQDDEEEKEQSMEIDKLSPVSEFMPSLIVCDDDDDEEGIEMENKLNETFEADDSVKFVNEFTQEFSKQIEGDMETLQIPDDSSETPKKPPRVDLIDTELNRITLLSTPKRSTVKFDLPSTPKTDTIKLPSTPKQSLKTFRFPTPHIKKDFFEFKNDIKGNSARKTRKMNVNASITSLTTMEPKEMVRRGIRKRSLSVCIDGNNRNRQKFLAGNLAEEKQDRIVSFYSPANQTTMIDDLDMLIAKSLKKQKPKDYKEGKFVTTRRKRSISFDESVLTGSQISKLPRPVVNQGVPCKIENFTNSTSKPLTRTKLPNFAAIHQKQFKKMENLLEHVNRKQERSKNLINSATKLRPVSAQKIISVFKNNNSIASEKPKALKKIDIGASTQFNKTLFDSTNPAKEVSITKAVAINNLPDPRIATKKPLKSSTISHKQAQEQSIKKYLKPSQATNVSNSKVIAKPALTKPNFNLSTSVTVKPTTTTSSSMSFGEKANMSCTSAENKMTSRLQRHMELFKGRDPSARARAASRKNEVILKGVRSNRRFELQMQHRKNMEQ